MLTRRLGQSCLFIALWALVAPAHASYAQMRLDGLGLLLALALSIAWGVVVDLALLARIFRHRAAVVAGSIIALGVVLLLLSQAASPGERAGFFKGAPGGAALVVLVVMSAVFLPFCIIAPFAQHQSMRTGRRWPGWIGAWMGLQLVLLPGFLVLAGIEQYFWQQEYRTGQAEGRAAGANGLGRLLEHAEQKHERIWGTGWHYPWQQESVAGYPARPSAWSLGLAESLDASALITANEPLNAPDRAALHTLMTRHFGYYAFPNTRAKLIWDTLEPGGFSKQLAPNGLDEAGVVGEEVIPVLLERLERYGDVRLCPGGLMMDDDRAVLNALIQAKGRTWNVEKRAHEMSPQWESYRLRLERLCRGHGNVGSE